MICNLGPSIILNEDADLLAWVNKKPYLCILGMHATVL